MNRTLSTLICMILMHCADISAASKIVALLAAQKDFAAITEEFNVIEKITDQKAEKINWATKRFKQLLHLSDDKNFLTELQMLFKTDTEDNFYQAASQYAGIEPNTLKKINLYTPMTGSIILQELKDQIEMLWKRIDKIKKALSPEQRNHIDYWIKLLNTIKNASPSEIIRLLKDIAPTILENEEVFYMYVTEATPKAELPIDIFSRINQYSNPDQKILHQLQADLESAWKKIQEVYKQPVTGYTLSSLSKELMPLMISDLEKSTTKSAQEIFNSDIFQAQDTDTEEIFYAQILSQLRLPIDTFKKINLYPNEHQPLLTQLQTILKTIFDKILEARQQIRTIVIDLQAMRDRHKKSPLRPEDFGAVGILTEQDFKNHMLQKYNLPTTILSNIDQHASENNKQILYALNTNLSYLWQLIKPVLLKETISNLNLLILTLKTEGADIVESDGDLKKITNKNQFVQYLEETLGYQQLSHYLKNTAAYSGDDFKLLSKLWEEINKTWNLINKKRKSLKLT